MKRGGYIYIMTNKTRTTLYVGVTSNLKRRISEHKDKINNKSFTYRYNLVYLVYYEGFHNIQDAIAREKQIKAGSRLKKDLLINSMNPDYNDLYDSIPFD